MLAIRDEIDSLRAYGTWVLTPLPPKHRFLSVTWLFTMKIGLTGLVERYKARFVVKGFLQKTWNLFSEVYAPVSSKAGLRIFLSAIPHRKMFVRQLDIKTAFLNGVLEPNLDPYCHQPQKASECLDLMALHLCVNLSSPLMV